MTPRRVLYALIMIVLQLVVLVLCMLIGRGIDVALTATIGAWQSDVTGWVVVGTLALCWFGGAFRPKRGEHLP